MDQNTYLVPQGFQWPQVGRPGTVPLWALVPNPNQPRTNFDDFELNELAETMNPDNGGELREIVAVRILTKDERALYDPARYMLISGERRWRSAALAGLSDIEIRVKSYKDLRFEMLDMFMLNENRVGLSDIENAEYVAKLADKFKWETQGQIAKGIGKDQVWVSQILALLKLSPNARTLFSPKLKEYERATKQVGVFLSKLEHKVQDDFVERMPKGDRVTGSQQIRWMQAELQASGVEVVSRQLQPSTLRRVTGYFAGQVERRVSELLAFENINKLFENATGPQKYELYKKMESALKQLTRLSDLVSELSGIRPVTAEAGQKTRSAPARASADVEHAVHAVAKAKHVLQAKSVPAAQSPAAKITCDVWDDNAGRYTSKTISPARYVELWEKKKLKFVGQNLHKPAHLPTLEEAKNMT